MRGFTAAALLGAAALGFSQGRLERLTGPVLPPGIPLDSKIPSPDKFLGFAAGTRYARSHEVVEYLRETASQSPRVKVEVHGRTWEGRPLIHAVISSPRNIARLEAIRAANRRLTFSAGAVSDEELKAMPLVLWIGAGVHGDEPSATEAALHFFHLLAAGQGEIAKMLEDVVVVMDPILNPDGRERHVGWQNAMRGQNPTPDLQDMERANPWPAGRTNHYWFDLNRDWLPLSQIESQQRHKVYTSWRPQVTLDYHEMGSGLTYFFQPGVPSRVHPVTPASNQDWTRKFASYHAKALEAVGERYFTEERFDDFYAGKGSTYPDLTGSIGILFEQSSSRGMISQLTRETVRYVDRVRNQAATMLSSLRASYENRLGLLRHQKSFFGQPAEGQGGWVIADDDAGRELVQLLLRHEIRVVKTEEGFGVPASQPLSRLAEVIFAPLTKFQDTTFYDISAWAAPFASEARISESKSVEGIEIRASDLQRISSKIKEADKPLGWIIRSGRLDFHRAVALAIQAGHRAWFVRRPVGKARPGDVFVTGGPNLPEVLKDLRVDADAVPGQTGEVASWGGSGLVEIGNLKIALIAGPGVDINNTGEVWHHLDAVMGLQVSVVAPTASLDRYDVVILAGGSYPEAFAASLGAWVRAGGTLVATSKGASWVTGTEIWKAASVRHTGRTSGQTYAEANGESGRHTIPGSFFRLEWDPTHPLSFGAETPYSFREGQSFWEGPFPSGTVVAKYASEPLAAGYASQEVQKLASGKPAVLAQRLGSGRVVLIADNPLFRGWATTQRRLFLNSVFFSGAF